jgi:DNA-binding NarL/FixJ family response regulator
VTKDEINLELNKAVGLIAEGMRGWISPGVAEKLSFASYTDKKIPSYPLDEKEKSVLKEIVEGKTDLEIGENLNLESPIVGAIVNAILKKM